MNERLKFLGRLEEKRLEAEGLKVRMLGLRESIRDTLDPFEPLEDLKTDVSASQAMELAALQIRYKEILAEMGALKKALCG